MAGSVETPIETKLINSISHLENELALYKKTLFAWRLCQMIDIPKHADPKTLLDFINRYLSANNVTNLQINVLEDSWFVCYEHNTLQYDENNYNYNEDSECETQVLPKKTIIKFGKNANYFIKRVVGIQTCGTRFKIYRNSENIMRVINSHYDMDLDLDEQYDLISTYKYNKNIPEWVALRVFHYLLDNDWEDNDIITYLKEL